MSDELNTLKERADLLNISYHPSIGVEKLREKVNAALAEQGITQGAEQEKPPETPPVVQAPVVEDPVVAKRNRLNQLKQEQLKLVRIRLTCMNPAKKEWDGEIITVGNDLVGTVCKYIPFNADEGWHVPQIMLDMLRSRQCQVFHTEKTRNGVSMRRGKLINEFAVEVLPQLSEDEIKDLAQRQAMAKSGA